MDIAQPRLPYGDAFIVSSPEIDKVNQQLYQEQLRRQMYAQQEGKAMDNVVNREFAKVKGSDVGPFTDAYQKYKSITQNQLFNKQLQNDPKAYAQVQADRNAALADVFRIANESQADKARLMGYQQKYNSPNGHYLFADDFPDKFKKAMSMTTEELKNSELGSDDAFYDKGVQNFNFGAIHKTAQGALQPNGYEKVVPVGADGLQEDHIVHKSYVPPAAYKANLINALSTGKGGKWASAYIHSIDPAEIAATHQAYLNLTPQDWLERTGKPQPRDVSATDPKNDVDAATTYLAEKNFVNSQPVVEPTRRLTNTGAMMQARQKIALDNFYKEQRQRHIDKIAEQDNSSANTANRQKVAADEGSAYYENLKAAALPSVDAGLQPYKALPLDPKTRLDLSIDHKTPIDEARLMANGNVDIYQGGQKIETLPEAVAKTRIIQGMLGAAAARKSISTVRPHTEIKPTVNSGIKWQ